MPLPDYIKPGLYINNLNKVTSISERVPELITSTTHPTITNIKGKNNTEIDFAMEQYACKFQELGTGRRPGLNIITKDESTKEDDAFLYVFQNPGKIAIGYLNVPLSTNMHIYSDNFGGCEWHVLSRNQDDENTVVAFLHVYKGNNKTCQYTTQNGWTLEAILSSSISSPDILNKLTELGITNIMNCSLAAYAYIAAGTTTVDTCMLILDQESKILGLMQETTIVPGLGGLDLDGNGDRGYCTIL